AQIRPVGGLVFDPHAVFLRLPRADPREGVVRAHELGVKADSKRARRLRPKAEQTGVLVDQNLTRIVGWVGRRKRDCAVAVQSAASWQVRLTQRLSRVDQGAIPTGRIDRSRSREENFGDASKEIVINGSMTIPESRSGSHFRR